MWRHFLRALPVSSALGLALAACGSAAGPVTQMPRLPGHWVRFRHVTAVVDLAGPRGGGSFTVAAAGRLFLLSRAGLSRAGGLSPFARGPGGYSTALGPEPYITLTGADRVAGTLCSFGNGTIVALQPGARPAIIVIGTDGRATRFTVLPAADNPTGITYDSTGHFGHRILVTAKGRAATAVLAIDCAGGIRTITSHAPSVEGGIAVAPASFGRYGGDLIAPQETSGHLFAIAPDGSVVTLAVSGLPHGGDIGVESAGFVPPGFGAGDGAYLADRFSKGNRHPGTDSILRLRGSELVKAGVRPGDLLVATEASARTIAVRCRSSCTVTDIAVGPIISHAEGHIVFTRPGQ